MKDFHQLRPELVEVKRYNRRTFSLSMQGRITVSVVGEPIITPVTGVEVSIKEPVAQFSNPIDAEDFANSLQRKNPDYDIVIDYPRHMLASERDRRELGHS